MKNMVKHWHTIRLGDACVTNASSYSPKEVWTFVNYLDTGNITENRIDSIQHIDLAKEELPSRAKRKVKKNSIIYSTVRPNQRHYGIIKTIPQNFLVSTGFAVIDADSQLLDADFLYYVLTQATVVDKLHAIAAQSTSAYPSLRPSDIENLEIDIPTLDEQRAIASILRCIDEKTQLNAQINRNLEQQAQAIFKSWFVDFAPFRDGKFMDSELGPIPAGWRVGTLEDIADITMGQSPKGESYNENSVGTVFYQGRAEFTDRFPVRRLFTTEPKRMATSGDVLLSVRAPVGDMNIANEPCCIGRGLATIHAKHGFTSFVFYTMQTLRQELDKYNGEGTVFGCINKDSLNALKVIIPPENIISVFEERTSPLDRKYFVGIEENMRLTKLRDTLLQKLMSGEIDVSEVEV